MKLLDTLREECIAVGAKPADKQTTMRTIARLAKRSSALKGVSEEEVLQALRAREEIGTTGFGKGVAIPHCRMAGVDEFVVGVLTCEEGLDFDSVDNEKVRLIFFIVAPTDRSGEHIRLLSAISQIAVSAGAVDELARQPTAVGVVEFLAARSGAGEEPATQPKKSLFHVFVQDESAFDEILNVFIGMDDASLVIVDAESSRVHLAKMPLFAGLWGDDYSAFSKIIVAVVKQGLANEAIRQIEQTTGALGDRADVMVLVQNVFYAAGNIET